MSATPSLKRVCLDVKMPDVIKKQNARSYVAVFVWLFQNSDQHALIELNATEIAQDLGFSRQQIYRAIKFLMRVNLLKYKIYRTGRGNHSLVWLNWRKPEQKCNALSKRTKSKNHIHDEQSSVSTTNGPKNQWTRMMGAFRRLISHSWLQTSEREHSLRMIGKCVRERPVEWTKELFHRLAAMIHTLDVPEWVMEIRQFYAWFRKLINRLMKQGVQAQKAAA